MAIYSIQERINQITRNKAERDFREAVEKARNLLIPFFEPLKFTEFRGNTEVVDTAAEFAKCTRIDERYASFYLCKDMKVPEAYVKNEQAKASLEFVKKVDELQAQIDELYGDMER